MSHLREGRSARGLHLNLARIGEKINYGYLVEWIMNPKGKEPITCMPSFRLSQEKQVLLPICWSVKQAKVLQKEGLSDAGWLEDKERARVGGGADQEIRLFWLSPDKRDGRTW